MQGTGVYVLAVLLAVSVGIVAFVVYKAPAKRQFLGDIVLPAVFIAVACLFAAIASGFSAEDAGPEVIPYLWSLLLIVFSAAIIILAWMGKIEPPRKIGRLDVLIKFIGATIAYLIGMQFVGYYLTTGIFLIAVIYALGYRRYVTLTSVAGGWLLFAYIVFQRTLYVPFPVGKLWKMIAD